MPASVRVGGAWKSVSAVSTRVGGAWKNVGAGYTRIAGVWKQWLSGDKFFVALKVNTTYGYIWQNGFGTKYTGNDGGYTRSTAIDISTDSKYFAWGSDTQSYISASFTSETAIFGTQITNPVSLMPNRIDSVSFGGNDTLIGVSCISSPYIGVYNFSSAGFGTRFSSPASLPAGGTYHAAVHPDGSAILVAGVAGSTNIKAYSLSGGGFGTEFSTSAVYVGFSLVGIAFNKTGTQVGMGASGLGAEFQVFPWSNGFGTKYTNPSGLPSQADFLVTGKLRFHPNNTAISLNQDRASIYNWSSSGFGTAYSIPADSQYNIYHRLWSPSGTVVANTSATSPYVQAYPWTPGVGYGTKYADPLVAGATAQGTVFG